MRNFRTFSTGSASIIQMTEEEKKEVEEKEKVKIPFGFCNDDNQTLTDDTKDDKVEA